MTTHRTIIRKVGLIFAAALAIAAATPLGAHAGPLLSGYGGPGQGNQAILGQTLLGGPGGGSPGTPSGPRGGEASAQGGGGEGAGQPTGSRAGTGSGRAHHHGASAGLVGASAAGELAERSYPAVEVTSGASGALGLSGADILYIVLAAVALASTGALTKLVAGARTAKGHR